jgi:hypothetical protein
MRINYPLAWLPGFRLVEEDAGAVEIFSHAVELAEIPRKLRLGLQEHECETV